MNRSNEHESTNRNAAQLQFVTGNGFSSNNNFPQASSMVNRMCPHEHTQTATSDRAVLQHQPIMIQRQMIEPRPTTNSGGRIIFPVKLHEILSDHTTADIISWQPHGRSWRVHKPLDFEKHVIHRFFKQTKFASFTRQVNGWGFKRITEGPDKGGFYHEVSCYKSRKETSYLSLEK